MSQREIKKNRIHAPRRGVGAQSEAKRQNCVLVGAYPTVLIKTTFTQSGNPSIASRDDHNGSPTSTKVETYEHWPRTDNSVENGSQYDITKDGYLREQKDNWATYECILGARSQPRMDLATLSFNLQARISK